MKLGILFYGSLATVSGGYLYDRQLVGHLRAVGHQVVEVSLPWRNYARHLLDNLSPALDARLAALDFDLLLQDELNHPSLWWLNHRLSGRYPLVAIVHHLRACEARPAWQNSLYQLLERRYLASVDAFIFNSRTTRTAVERLVGGHRPSIVAYPAGDRLGAVLDQSAIERRAAQAGPLRLLFVGNIIPRKGLHTLLTALIGLSAELAQLTVVGSLTVDAGYVARCRRQIERAGLADRVRLLGAVSDERLTELLADSHLLVAPSSYEGFGIVYIEAMRAGLPVIATTAGAAAELIDQGEQGWLIAPEDHGRLAEHLRSLAGDRRRLVRLGLAARHRALAQPNWSATTGAIERFLVELAGRWEKERP